MPYDKRKKGDEWEVYNTDTGDVKGTHPTEEKANAQLAALYIHASPEKENKMDKTIFIPIAKIDEQRHEVWGYATNEAPDNADEIMDYNSSKPHFLDWSRRAEKRSGGKSKGNVRAMHQPVAAGILLEMRPDDVAKGFYIGAKVTDDQEWGKVLTGTYTGFSIGGTYMKRWSDPMNPGRIRYTAKPHEISLVDSPCNPEATFDVLKADGSIAKSNFLPGEGKKILVIRKADDDDESEDESVEKVAGGYDDLRQKLQAGLSESFPYQNSDGTMASPSSGSRFWIDDWNADTVWVCEGQKFFEIHYTLGEEGKYSFGQPMEVTRTVSFSPVSQPEVAKADAPGAPEPVADINLDSEVGPDYAAEKMPQPNTPMEMKPGTTPSQESLAGHTVFAESVEAVMNAWLPKIGETVESSVNKILDERGLVKNGENTGTAPTQKIAVFHKNSIKVVRKERNDEIQK
ncbi:MAG: hypothetical protein M0R06_02665 [Sphaerochaeta sp.]|nr:hypothetical protein [Sphaerochaeta sp.]